MTVADAKAVRQVTDYAAPGSRSTPEVDED